MSSDETRDIRYAADTIYRNLPQSSHPSQRSLRKYSGFFLINYNFKFFFMALLTSIDYYFPEPERYARINFLNYITEEYIAGFTHNGQMSNVRRFFCLFVTFDLFFISLLWLIQIMASIFDVSLLVFLFDPLI